MRMVSVWLPRWPIRRFLAAQTRNPVGAPVDPARPFVLSVDAAGGPRIAALNEAAEGEGLALGALLADARARAEGLQVRPADHAADAMALRRLALWATRYSPLVAAFRDEDGADGFFIDITGAAHLLGGEEALLSDLAARLETFGLPARLALAGTAGAAWALSRFHPEGAVIIAPGREAKALAPLSIRGLRLSAETQTTLRRLGFKEIGALIDKPRAPFAARFETKLLRRIDQALGRANEPVPFISPPPVYCSRRHLVEPIATQEAVVAVAARLMRDLVPQLARDDVGVRALRLLLYRIDGEVATLDLGLVEPTRSGAHIARLIGLKLDRILENPDADFGYGFGFETVALAVTLAERIHERQLEMAAGDINAEARMAALLDSLRERLGPANVRQLQPVESHLPERAEISAAATTEVSSWNAPDLPSPRPPFLFARPEPTEVTALVPEGPPRRFRWRGATHDIAHAQGPERIACEWWRASAFTRDYYLVEDEAGGRFWLYREGLYGRETEAPRWFVHGLFA